MSDLLTLTCPTCGAKLAVTDQIHLLACRSCGNEFMVHRNMGAIYLAPIAQDVKQIRVGVDKTAAELAVARLTKEIEQLNASIALVNAQTLEQWIPETVGEGALRAMGMLAIVFTFVAFVLGHGSVGFILFIALIGCLGGFSYLKHRRTVAAHTMCENELSRLNDMLTAKHAQLQRNRQIADS
jgi:hypothetical protein